MQRPCRSGSAGRASRIGAVKPAHRGGDEDRARLRQASRGGHVGADGGHRHGYRLRRHQLPRNRSSLSAKAQRRNVRSVMAATAVPTLTVLLSWNTEHLTEGAQYWERTADRWDSAFAEVEQQIGASGWEGEAFGAATERGSADKVRVGNVADDLREGARTARQGASDVSAARSRLRYMVEAAQDAGFDVYDDYTVASRQIPATAAEQAALQAQAESFAEDIYGGAAQLVARDQQVGAGIAAAVGQVGNLTFDEH